MLSGAATYERVPTEQALTLLLGQAGSFTQKQAGPPEEKLRSRPTEGGTTHALNPLGENNPACRRGVPQSTPGNCDVLGAMAQGTPKPCPGHANINNARSCTHKVCAANPCTASKSARHTTHVGREPWRRPVPNPHKRLARQAGEKASSPYMSLCEALCGQHASPSRTLSGKARHASSCSLPLHCKALSRHSKPLTPLSRSRSTGSNYAQPHSWLGLLAKGAAAHGAIKR